MGRTFHQVLRLFCCATLLLAACNKDGNKGAKPTGTTVAPPVTQPGERNLYIACEGAFMNANASLYMQNLASFTMYDDVYRSVNGKELGDVFQSMQRIGDKLFLCINNSDKVLVLDAVNRKQLGVINIPKPRYILSISPDKAYVSTLYSNKVYIINPQNMTITGTIEMPAQNPEGMMLLGNRAYICTWDVNCNKVYIVSILTDQVADSYAIGGYAPQQVLRDGDGFVWVLSGNAQKNKQAALTKLAPGGADVVQTLIFNQKQDPIKPVLSKDGLTMYYIGVDYDGTTGYNGVYKMNVRDGVLPGAPYIAAQKFQYYWGLGLDPLTDDIYVGDPKGFIQKGTVSVYSAAGEQKKTFSVGVGPGYFYFDE